MILLVGSEKGGTGKTTLVTNLSVLRGQTQPDLLLVDTDRQASASAWTALREDRHPQRRISSVQKFGEKLGQEMKVMSHKYQDLLIDAGGQNSVELRSAMVVAHRMLIPIRAGQFDVWTLGLMNQLLSHVKALNPDLDARVVINGASTNPSLQEEIQEAASVLEEFEHLKLAQTIIKERVAYRKAAKEGMGITELTKLDPRACEEINQLYQEIYS